MAVLMSNVLFHSTFLILMPYLVAVVEKLFGSIIRRTREEVPCLRDRTSPNREEVMQNLLIGNHNEDILCSRVSLSIFRACSGLSSMSFLKAVIVAFNPVALGIFCDWGCCGSVDVCAHMGLNSNEIESCSPRIVSRSGNNLLAANPRSSGGLGSNSSKGLKNFSGLAYSCFWKVASDIFKVDAFRVFGAFHWHRRDIMGVSSSVSSAAEILGCSRNVIGLKLVRA